MLTLQCSVLVNDLHILQDFHVYERFLKHVLIVEFSALLGTGTSL